MLGNFLLVITYTVATGLILTSLWHLRRANLVFWFIVFQWIIATGTFVVVDLSRFADILYSFLFFVALLSFTVGAHVTTSILGIKHSYRIFFNSPIEEDCRLTNNILLVVVLIAALVSILYYKIIGYNLFADAILGREIADFKSARLATYSGEQYYAPGYVNQFKNILLPVGMFVFCLWFWLRGQRILFLSFSLLTIGLCLYVLLGTGQRAPLVYSFLTLLFGLATLTRLRLSWLIIASFLLVVLFGLFSVLNERIEGLDPLSMIASVLKRVFVNDQQEGLWGFRHVLNLGTAWFSDWWLGVLGILPGHKGSPLTHDLYFLLHGTTRGTSSMSTVGSVYHNGGFLFLTIFYLFLGCAYASIYNRLLTGRRTVLRGMGYGGLFFILSVFVSGPPIVLVNKGLLAFLVLLIIRKI